EAFRQAHRIVKARLQALLALPAEVWDDRAALKDSLDRIGFVQPEDEASVLAEATPRMGLFERYLTLWVALCIVVGTGLGHFMPGAFAALGGMEVAKVNLPVAALIWLMIIPMLLK